MRDIALRVISKCSRKWEYRSVIACQIKRKGVGKEFVRRLIDKMVKDGILMVKDGILVRRAKQVIAAPDAERIVMKNYFSFDEMAAAARKAEGKGVVA